MSETVDEFTSQLDKLNKARANGTRSVRYLEMDFRRELESDRELQAAKKDLERRIAAMQSGGKGPSEFHHRRASLASRLKGTAQMKNFIQIGHTIPVAAPAPASRAVTAFSSNRYLAFPPLMRHPAIPSKTTPVGVFDLPKAGTPLSISAGARVFWDAAASECKASAAGYWPIGCAIVDAGANDKSSASGSTAPRWSRFLAHGQRIRARATWLCASWGEPGRTDELAFFILDWQALPRGFSTVSYLTGDESLCALNSGLSAALIADLFRET